MYPFANNHFSTTGASRSTHLANPFTKSRLCHINTISSDGRYLIQAPIEALDILILEERGNILRFLFRRKFPKRQSNQSVENDHINRIALVQQTTISSDPYVRGVLPVIFHGLPP